MSHPTFRRRAAFVALAMLVAAGAVSAQDRGRGREPAERRPRPGAHFDDRYHHDHWYPPRGHVAPVLPGGAVGVPYRGGQFWFHGGVWFRASGPRFVVTVPPIGIVVPLLPPAYVSLWIGGAPYYYANGVYYAPLPGQGYEVVDPPPGASTAQPAAPAASAPPPDPVIYPRSGQSAAQTETDRQECNRWATTQPSAVADASVFQRAVAACLEGRGYTVR